MGSKVCGLCISYKVDSYRGAMGDKGDACSKNGEKVRSLQKACEDYETTEPINVKEKETEKTTKKTGKGRGSKESK